MNKENLKIVFLGTPEFAVESLDRLVTSGYNVAAVITMPDKVAGRGHKLIHSPVKQYAVEKGLRLMQPERLKDPAFIDELRAIDADLFIVIAFRMLPEAVWTMPRLGTFNLHGSLLPRYRGAAPINWAIINGDKRTGVTTFFLKHEIDTGDIIQQESIDILPSDDFGSVYDKLMHLGADLTINTVEAILAGTLKPMPQDQLLHGEEATPAPKIFKDTCRIDWSLPAERVHNLVRGLAPYPAAWTMMANGDQEPQSFKILKTEITDEGATRPGAIAIDGNRLKVDCADLRIEVKTLQPQGKKAMDAADFLRGAHLRHDAAFI